MRAEFHDKTLDEEKLLESLTYSVENDSLTTLGYHGLIHMMLADYEWWPFDKLKSFNIGKEKIEIAIGSAPQNLELRYIRLLAQLNAPPFLGYYDQTSLDINYLKENFKTWRLKNTWGEIFINQLLESKHLKKDQIEILEGLNQQIN